MKKLMMMKMIIIIGERARHSQVCSIENRGYIYYIYTRKMVPIMGRASS